MNLVASLLICGGSKISVGKREIAAEKRIYFCLCYEQGKKGVSLVFPFSLFPSTWGHEKEKQNIITQ